MPTSMSNGKIAYATRWKKPLGVGFWKSGETMVPDYVVASLSGNPGLAIYDATNNVKVTGHPTFINGCVSAAISRDGTLLAVGEKSITTYSGKLRLYNVNDWSEITIPQYNAWIGDIAIHKNNDLILFTSNGENGCVNFGAIKKVGGTWVDTNMPSPSQTVTTQSTPVKFNSEHTKAFFGGINNTNGDFIRLDVNTLTIETTNTFNTSLQCGNWLTININDNNYVAGSDQASSVWNINVLNFDLDTLIYSKNFTSVGFMCFSFDGSRLWMLRGGQIRGYIKNDYANYDQAVNPKGSGVGVSSRLENKLYYVGTNYWQVFDGDLNLIHELHDSDVGNAYRISAANGMF